VGNSNEFFKRRIQGAKGIYDERAGSVQEIRNSNFGQREADRILAPPLVIAASLEKQRGSID
jgi:hypothetical protein